jgi:hypothetical protein
MPALQDVTDLIHDWYPPSTAESWDAVGLVHGDPARQVKKVLFAVDATPEVAVEAADLKADLLVVHHPLFLKPVHGFAAETGAADLPKATTSNGTNHLFVTATPTVTPIAAPPHFAVGLDLPFKLGAIVATRRRIDLKLRSASSAILPSTRRRRRSIGETRVTSRPSWIRSITP